MIIRTTKIQMQPDGTIVIQSLHENIEPLSEHEVATDNDIAKALKDYIVKRSVDGGLDGRIEHVECKDPRTLMPNPRFGY